MLFFSEMDKMQKNTYLKVKEKAPFSHQTFYKENPYRKRDNKGMVFISATEVHAGEFFTSLYKGF